MLNNICFVISQLEIGGAEKYVLELASACSKLNLKVHIISLGSIDWRFVDSFNNLSSNTKVAILKTTKIFSLSTIIVIYKLCRYIIINKITLLHLNLRIADIIGGLAAIFTKRKFILTQHDTQPWRYSKKFKDVIYKYLHRGVASKANAIIVPTFSVKNYLIETEHIPPQKIKIIYHGINVNNIKFVRQKIEDDVIFIGTIAKFRPEKGHIYIIRALPKILKEIPHKKVNFLFAGDGPMQNIIREESKRLGVNSYVKFLGRVYDIPKFLEDLHILVQAPLSSEAFCYAVVEGLAAGKAVIATNIDGIPEIIHHRQNGILIPAASSDAIADAVITLIQENGLYSKIIANARKDCISFFSIARMIKETYLLYYEING